MKANYYRATKVRGKYGALLDHNGNEIDEEERGLTKPCELVEKATGRKGLHEWLMLTHEKGQKEYVMCLNCKVTSHL